MRTVIYPNGETLALGWPARDPDGGPFDLSGLTFELVVIVPSAPDIFISGYATTGDMMIDGVELDEASVMAFDISPFSLPLQPGEYRAYRRINDGSGWRIIPASEFFIEIRSYE